MNVVSSARKAVVLASAAALVFALPAFGSPEQAVLLVDSGTKTVSGETLEAHGPNQSVVAARGTGTVDLQDASLTKDGSAGTAGNQGAGANAAVVASDLGALVSITGGQVNTQGESAEAVCARSGGSVMVSGLSISTADTGASGVVSQDKGLVMADGLMVDVHGLEAAPLLSEDNGQISVTRSRLSAEGTDVPVVRSRGNVEVNDVRAVSLFGPLVQAEENGRVLVNNSTVESRKTGELTGIELTGKGTQVFQAANSTLRLAANAGELILAREGTANVVLVSTTLSYAQNSASLARVADAGTLNLTSINQKMEGTFDARDGDLNLWLRKGSVWGGSVEQGSHAHINVCPTSTWIVTQDCEVSDLNVKDGGRVVDADGRKVTVKRGDEVVVAGDSPYTVSVTGSYGTSFEVDATNELATDLLERGGFDNRFGVQTVFQMGIDSLGIDWSDCHCGPGENGTNAGRELPWWESAWKSVVDFFKWLFNIA